MSSPQSPNRDVPRGAADPKDREAAGAATVAAPRALPGFWTALAALVLAAIAMGISPIFVRLAGIGPFASAFWRVALALPLLYGWMRLEERGRPAPAPAWTRAVWLSGLLFAGDLFFWHLAIRHTTVANATFFATTSPIWVALLLAVVFRERIRHADLLGLAMCLAGGATLLGESLQVDPARVTGDIYGVATSLFFGSYVIAVDRARGNHGAARLMLRSTAITAAVLLPIALVLEPVMLPQSAFGWSMLLALAVVSQVGGQGLFAYAIAALPTVFSSLVIFIEALAAAAFGWLILGEALSPIQAAGGLVILAGLWVARPRRPANAQDGVAPPLPSPRHDRGV